MKMKVDTLIGSALNYAVSVAQDVEGLAPVAYSTHWQFGGPIIEQVGISVSQGNQGGWWASYRGEEFHAETPLVAAMRCYVFHTLGDDIEVPSEFASK